MNSTTSRAVNISTRPQQWAAAFGSQKRSTMAIMTLLIWLVMTVDVAQPADTLYLCMKNCEQCKSMYGAYFEGDLCAKSCFRLKGAFIPDCIDVASIGQFLNKNE
ncbi:prepropeptide encoding eclosion hormone [Daphnia sinensis]|uniref:Prepropeptide encoding eclosion hormone n=1 Tax=Daphnia sinensis TaxID=1820382 RepID=A0AAD5L632_9CRUS|nr:prepropeptide encoding eclosion hormone [Daphnia sinensis]